MKEEIFKNTIDFASFTLEDIGQMLAKGTIKQFKRQENIISIGQKNNFVGYLKNGLLRSYYYDNKGNEQTTAFIEQGSFFSELKSYQTQEPSERTIEAIAPSEIIIWKSSEIQSLKEEIPNLEIFEIKYFEKILKDKINFQRELTIRTKKEALELLINKYPQTAKYAPKQYIASFLGMTPYTLSRIKL